MNLGESNNAEDSHRDATLVSARDAGLNDDDNDKQNPAKSILRRTRLYSNNLMAARDGNHSVGNSEKRKTSANRVYFIKPFVNRTSRRNSNFSDSTAGTYESKSSLASFWTRLANNKSIWNDDIDEVEHLTENYPLSFKRLCESLKYEVRMSWRTKANTIKAHPHIIFVTIICLTALITISIALTITFAKQFRNEKISMANDLALETGNWFNEQLRQAMFPLFALKEFMKEMAIFHDLPFLIGQGGENGSAPYKTNSSIITHRNVSGICDNSTIQSAFVRISKGIKDRSKMNGVLVSLSIMPHDVGCMFYPLNNTEDFTPPLYLDNSGAVGHDLLKDPGRVAIAVQTHASNAFTVAGPLTLVQCPNCPPAVKTAFIARLPVNMPGYNLYAGGVNYSSWGLVSAIINWEMLLKNSDIFQRFESKGIQFELSKKEQVLNTSTNQYFEKTSILAQSVKAQSIKSSFYHNFSLPKATQSNWTMAVAFDEGIEPPWFDAIIALSVVLSFLLTVMFFFILIEKQQNKNLLQSMLPAKALKKIGKGGVFIKQYHMVSIFFCDIVGYTSMATEMQPIEVMEMLNSFFKEVDILAEKHKVYKIKIIGDAYMCVGGCPYRCSAFEGAERVALFALDLIEFVKSFRTDDGLQISVRAGIHSGAVVAGVIERKRPQYTIFGHAVDVASSMESSSHVMKIQCSHVTSNLLNQAPNYGFSLVERGFTVNSKELGQFKTYFIEGARKHIQ